MTTQATAEDLRTFIRANDTHGRAFGEWPDVALNAMLLDSSYKKYMTFDRNGVASLAISRLTSGTFHLTGIIIREDLGSNGFYLASLVLQFLNYYGGLTMTARRRGKDREIDYSLLHKLCKRPLNFSRISHAS